MRGYFVDRHGDYYEGDRVHALDIEVPQRPTPDHRWENGAWAVDAPEVLAEQRAIRIVDVMDKLVFDQLFAHEKLIARLRGQTEPTRAEYRAQLIERYKTLNA
jgi:hypothetical protein